MMTELNKVEPGSKVAILSPSSGIAGLFPWVADYGIARMKKKFKLIPQEFPTTRKFGASLEERAVDINAAFANHEIKSIFSMIGGDDQIQLLKYLDSNLIKENPKPFFGYSDNTHLCNFLFNLGIPSFYGGSVMCEFAFNNSIPSETLQSIKWAISDRGLKDIKPTTSFNTIGLQWSDKTLLEKERKFEENKGFVWDGTSNATGILWGGCVESLIALTAADNDMVFQNNKDIILFLETSESIPPQWVINYYLVGLGERGLLGKNIKGIIVGRPKTWDFDNEMTKSEREQYSSDQIATVIKAVRHYDKSIPVVQNVDIGHTAPQYVVPMGNMCHIYSEEEKLQFQY